MLNEPEISSQRLQLVGLWCVGAYAISLIFDGVNRWVLDGAGMAALLYARDALPLFAMLSAWFVARSRDARPQQRLLVIVFSFLSVWLLWGLLQGLDPLQALFGAKTLLSIPAGIATWVLLQGRASGLPIFCIVAGTVACAGVVLDHFRDLPWAALVYELGDVRIEGQREWAIDNVARLGGFSRASFDVASQIGVMASLILVSGMGRFVRWPVVAVFIMGIILTTSRSALLGMLAVLACWSLLSSARLSNVRLALFPIVFVPVLAVLLVLGLPGLTITVAGMDRAGAASTMSFAMRTEGHWLDALGMLSNVDDWLMGLGLGGIGAAQKPFDPDAYVAPDNLFIYLLVSFGLVGSLLFFTQVSRAWLVALVRKTPVSFCILLPFLGVTGITISAVENPFIGMGFGLALADAVSQSAGQAWGEGGKNI